MTAQTVQPFVVREYTTPKYRAVIQDEDGVAIPAASLTTLRLTHYLPVSDAIVNSRDDQNVLNANDVTVSAEGALEWSLQEEDTALAGSITSGGWYQDHVALFEYTWDSGAKRNNHEVKFKVLSIHRIP